MPHLVSVLRFDHCLSFHKVNKIKFRFVKIGKKKEKKKNFRENNSFSFHLSTTTPFLLSFGLAIPFLLLIYYKILIQPFQPFSGRRAQAI